MNTLLIRTFIEPGDGPTDQPTLTTIIPIDGEALVRPDSFGIDIDQLKASTLNDGHFTIITCTCGDAGCAGITQGIRVYRDSRYVHWVVREVGPTRTYTFEPEAYTAAIERGIKQLRRMVHEHHLETMPATNTYYLQQMQ